MTNIPIRLFKQLRLSGRLMVKFDLRAIFSCGLLLSDLTKTDIFFKILEQGDRESSTFLAPKQEMYVYETEIDMLGELTEILRDEIIDTNTQKGRQEMRERLAVVAEQISEFIHNGVEPIFSGSIIIALHRHGSHGVSAVKLFKGEDGSVHFDPDADATGLRAGVRFWSREEIEGAIDQ